MNNCIFCKIIKGEIPAKKVYEDDNIIAFDDINPKADVHILVVPKKHIGSLIEISQSDKDLLGELIFKISEIAKKIGLDKGGYKVIANNGNGSGQIVFHLHFHLLGGWKMKAEGWKI